jgi:mRNA interferase RelE/StbE
VYGKHTLQFLERHREDARRLVVAAERAFAREPVPQGAAMLKGGHGVFRLRIGGFRILYRVNYAEEKIAIFSIDKRSRVYDR